MCFIDDIAALSINFVVAERPINDISDEMAIKHFRIFGQCNLGYRGRKQGLSSMFF